MPTQNFFNFATATISFYWLNYLIGFFCVLFFFFARKRFQFRDAIDVLVAGWFGLLLGARAFYVFVYYPQYYFKYPDQIFAYWNGGMSFHGALIGSAMAVYAVCKYKKISALKFTDELAMILPVFLGLGRIGNFLNGELPGRPSDLPWAVVFESVDQVARHPSSIYEAILEGPALWLVVFLFPRQRTAAFLMGYAVLRFIAEFFRAPDPQVGFLWGYFTLGQLLSVPILFCGFLLTLRENKKLYQNSKITSSPE